MKLLKIIVHALKLDKEEPAQAPTASAAPKDDGAVVAAIAAALHNKN